MTDHADYKPAVYRPVVSSRPIGKGRQEALLSCGHVLVARKLWPGKVRWACGPIPIRR